MIEIGLKKVDELLEAERPEEALTIFQKIDPVETIEYLLVKGKLDQKFQKFGDAINTYSTVLEIDSENEEAKNRIHLIQNILNFWNPEMFNP